MRRVGLSVVLLVVLSPSLQADCELVPRSSGAFRDTVLDVQVTGGRLWAAMSWGIQLYDRTVDPPRPVAALALPDVTRRLRVREESAWVASGSTVFAIREEGDRLSIAGSLDLGATIHDLLLDGSFLYAATGEGLVQLDLLLPASPAIARRLETGSGSAFALAKGGETLYVADGDSTFDAFSIRIPALIQRVGEVEAPFPLFTVQTGEGLVYASDGRRTEIFSGEGAELTALETLPAIGMSSVFPLTSSIAFSAGLDPTLRALDLTVPGVPVTMFEAGLVPAGGSVNRIEAIAGDLERIHVAAGDLGLLSWDIGSFRPPFVLRSYPFPAGASVFTIGDLVFVAATAGGIQRYRLSSDGSLSHERSWDSATVSTLHDGAVGWLLSSSGGSLVLWDTSGDMAAVERSRANLSAAVSEAILQGTTAWVVLEDRSFWRADMSSSAAPVERISGVTLDGIERGADSVALLEFTPEGTTRIRYFADGDLEGESLDVEIDGLALGAATIDDGGRGAAVTFRGVTLIDFKGQSSRVIAGTNTIAPLDASFAAELLLVLSEEEMQVRDGDSGDLIELVRLPRRMSDLHVAEDRPGRTVLTGSGGVISVVLDTTAKQPVPIPSTNRNLYYDRALIGGGRLHLVQDEVVDSWELRTGSIGAARRRLRLPGNTVDVAILGERTCSLGSDGTISCLGPSGALEAAVKLEEGGDAVYETLHAGGGAVFVSFSTGCLSGNCRTETAVLDQGLIRGGTLPGRVVELYESDDETKIWALTEMPSEIRRYDMIAPGTPSLRASVSAVGNPVSLARSATHSTIYALGSRLMAYDENSLALLGAQLDPWAQDADGVLRYVDQVVRIDGDCALIGGRELQPRVFAIAGPNQWVERNDRPMTSSIVRSATVADGTFHLLTRHTLELWSSHALPARRRPVRR